ncbi:MAG: L,D-transpeptidase family protein [Polyangiaceae bacterium]|nr:L,D-transpeptidase family protein [Polyangiaceae bacterium]
MNRIRAVVFATLLGVACDAPLGDPTPTAEAEVVRPTPDATVAPGDAASPAQGDLAAEGPQLPTPSPEAAGPHAEPAPPSLCPDGFTCDYEALARAPAPAITAVRVEKAAHRMHLLANDVVVRSYTIAIGWGGAGPKLREGDGVTPVGTYAVTGRLDTSPWHILLGVSYPNYEDVKRFARLKAEGKVPHDANIGFGIAIHGRPKSMADGEHKKADWTLGCVALDNGEIEEVAKLVKKGTPITIVD